MHDQQLRTHFVACHRFYAYEMCAKKECKYEDERTIDYFIV